MKKTQKRSVHGGCRIYNAYFEYDYWVLQSESERRANCLKHEIRCRQNSKIQVVGGKATVKAVTKFMAEVGKALLDLMLKRSQLVLRINSIHQYESLRDKAQQEIDRYISIMKNLNLQANTDQYLWDTLNRNIEFEQGSTTLIKLDWMSYGVSKIWSILSLPGNVWTGFLKSLCCSLQQF